MKNLAPRMHQHGFTLVEAIVTLVVTAIIAGTMVLFIQRPVRNYVDSAARAEVSDVADLALRRMAREIASALPNSVRVNTVGGVQFLEFIPTSGGGRYLSAEDNTITGTPLSFDNAGAINFNVVGDVPAMAPGDFIAIYNLGDGFTDADAYAGLNVASVTGIAAAQGFTTVTIGSVAGAATNPFAAPALAGRAPNMSPDQRFQVIGRPVVFRCDPSTTGIGTLQRSVEANFGAVFPQPALGVGALLANNVVACNFSMSITNRQSALVGMNLSLGWTNPNGGLETVTLTHQVHVNNTP